MQHRIHLSRIGVAGTLAALVMYIPAALAAEQSFDRTLSVNGSVTLHVSTGAGHIRVTPGSDNQVHITGHVKGNNNMGWFGGSSEDSVARVAQNPPIEQAGNIIRIGDDRAGSRPQHPHDALHQGALAVAVGAEQRHGLGRRHRQRHVLDRPDRAVPGVEPGDGEATGHGNASRPILERPQIPW